MKINEMWDGIFPFDEIDGQLIDDFPADDRAVYFGFLKLDVEVLVFVYIDDCVIEINDIEGGTTVELFIEVDEETIWSVTDEFLNSNEWGLVRIETQSREWMLEGAKAETGAMPDQ